MKVEELWRLSNYKELWGATVYLPVDKECEVILGETPLVKTMDALRREIAKLKDGEPKAYATVYKFVVKRETFTEEVTL